MHKYIPVVFIVGIVMLAGCANVPPDSTPPGGSPDPTTDVSQNLGTGTSDVSQAEDGVSPDDTTSVNDPGGDHPDEDGTETPVQGSDDDDTAGGSVPPGELPEPGTGLTFPKTPNTSIVVPPPRD